MIKIVGAGISGLVLARRIAETGQKVKVYESSNHIGGLLYDYIKDGYLVSDSGVHIFHTNDEDVLNFVLSYGDFCAYNHVVSADVYGTNFSINFPPSLNNRLNEEEFSNLYYFYSYKQWGKMPTESVLNRVKPRINNSLYFFKDKFVGLPFFGWSVFCSNLSDHPNIEIVFNHVFTLDDVEDGDKVYFTGRLDRLFNFKFGEMKYRTVEISYSKDGDDFANVMNKSIPNVPYTRVINWRRCSPFIVKNKEDLYGYEVARDSRADEVSPHYIVDGQDDVFMLYKKECEKYNIVPFGRIGGNRYINIDEAIKCAMTLPL